MTTKALGLQGLIWRKAGLAMAHKVMPAMGASACLLLAAGCVTWFRPTSPVLHKPSCDLSPVLTLQLPERIDALPGVPKTKTIVEEGMNKLTGRRHTSADIKEMFYLRRGDVEYKFILFYSDTGCSQWYESEKKIAPPVYREVQDNGLKGRVHYTEEPRADPEGGSGPMGYYISRADFQLRNLYVRVEATAHVAKNEKPQNDKLTNAVKELARILRGALTAKW